MQRFHSLNLGNLPIQFKRVNKHSSKYIIDKHWHSQPEIIMVVEGTLKLELDNRLILAQKNEIIYINSSIKHSAVPDNCEYISILFSYELLKNPFNKSNEIIENFENGNFVIKEHFFDGSNEADSKLIEIVASIITALEKGNDFSIILGLLYFFMGLIAENNYFHNVGFISKTNTFKNKELDTVLNYIKENYNKQISLSDIAQSVNMSPKYFNNFFKKNTGKTPFEFLMQYRIEQASTQLIQTDSNVTDIAYNVGFNDLSYFINVFKRFKGTSPLKFRNLHKNT